MVDVRRQVWAGAISHGADGCMLQATYKHADTPAFQDSVGSSVVAVCKVVPDGVLMFLPSYSMLDRLTTRWKVCEHAFCVAASLRMSFTGFDCRGVQFPFCIVLLYSITTVPNCYDHFFRYHFLAI